MIWWGSQVAHEVNIGNSRMKNVFDLIFLFTKKIHNAMFDGIVTAWE